MKRLMILGATGAVGSQVLHKALADDSIEEVVAPTRRPLSEHPKLQNPIVDFDSLPRVASWWSVDAVICCLGTTARQAGSVKRFRQVDHDYVIAAAKLAKQAGCQTYVYNSSLAANSNSLSYYLKVKGEVEQSLSGLNFSSLTLVRPSILDAEARPDFRLMESLALKVCRIIEPVMPRRWRPVKTSLLGLCMLGLAKEAEAGEKVIESELIQTF